MKNYNTILTEKLSKYQHYHEAKLNKYEYLTGREILPSNRKLIIEQAKFTYSPLGKAFEKQIKTIEDQGKKQIEALQDLKPKELEAIKEKPNYKHSKIFDELSNERIGDIYNISKEINFGDLICYFKDPCITPKHFIEFNGPMRICNEIVNGDKTIKKIEEDQKQFKSDLNEITIGDPRHKSINQLDTIKNVKNIYNSRQKVIDLFNDYAKIKSKAMHKAKK